MARGTLGTLGLTRGAAPSTGANEAKLFVSDGTGGLTDGDLYVRGPSDADPVSLSTPSVTAFIPFARVATTANVADLAAGAPLTVDGVTLVAGDRVWVVEQSTATQGGMYVVVTPGTGSDGAWVRADDAPAGATDAIYPGTSVFIAEGTQNSQTRSVVTNTGTITVGTTGLTFFQEAPLVRTDASSTEIKASTAFTTGVVWSSAVVMRDHAAVSVWFNPTTLGSNTQVDLYVRWGDDGSTITLGDDDGIQATDFLIAQGTTGTFALKDYVTRLTTAGGELVANNMRFLSFPKRGGVFYFGVKGNHASGTYTVRAQRLAGLI